jgi:oxygen tolerance protein BatD
MRTRVRLVRCPPGLVLLVAAALLSLAAPARTANAADSAAPAAGGARAAPDAGQAAASPPVHPAVPVDPEAPTVAAHADRNVAHVGDAITLTVMAVAKRGVPVNLPNVLELGAFSLLDRAQSETDLGDGRLRREFTLKVAAYEPGPQTIPAIEVTYLGPGGDVRQTRTQPVEIKIASLIANEPEPALKDNADPVAVLKQDLRLVYLAGGLLAAALGALVTWLIVRRLRQRVVVRPGPPPRPAHEIALERLDRLGAYGFLENADNRPFYFAVSEIIRDFLGGRFGFDSLELTTDELMEELRRRSGPGSQLILGEIGRWLAACDLVKFAKTSPTAVEARGTLEMAIQIVKSTQAPTDVSPASAPLAPEATAHG